MQVLSVRWGFHRGSLFQDAESDEMIVTSTHMEVSKNRRP